MSAAPTPASPLEALKAGFRRACVRRLVGDEEGAVQVLRDEIPGLVVGWAKSTPLDPSEKKAKLKEMFDDESGRADELAVAFDLFAGRFETRVAELVRTEVSSLADRVSQLTQDLTSAVRQVESITARLRDFKMLSLSDAHPTSSVQADFLSEDISSPPSDTQKTEGDSVLPEKIHPNKKSDKIENVTKPAKGLAIGEELPSEPIEADEQKKASELDPPSGTGLRFDEIEEMIDEILSYEAK